MTEADVTPKTDPTNHVGGTEIRDAKDATYTEEGYTGDTYCLGCGNKIAEGHAIPKLTPAPGSGPPSHPEQTCAAPVQPECRFQREQVPVRGCSVR